MNENQYMITAEQCASTIASVCDEPVCPGCGGPVTPIDTVDNWGNPTFWEGCEPCGRFTYPVPRIAFELADKIVRSGRHSNRHTVSTEIYSHYCMYRDALEESLAANEKGS